MNKIEPKIKRYISCPACGTGEHFIEHLLSDDRFKRALGEPACVWFCENEDCGKSFAFIIDPITKEVSIESRPEEWRKKSLVLLRIPPQDKSIFFIVEGSYFKRGQYQQGILESNNRYFYEEHQCPTNFTRDIVEMFIGSDTDPHGLFEYMTTAPYQSWSSGPRSMSELQAIFGTENITEEIRGSR